MKVRIRGIYATALSALLVENGIEVVEASPLIAERLGLPTDGLAEVSLRDRPDRQGVRLQSLTGAAEVASLARSLTWILEDAVARPTSSPASWDVEFPALSKRQLDQARGAVLPTLPGHHQLKVIDTSAVDRAEREIASGRDPLQLAANLRESLISHSFRPGRDLSIWHVKPAGLEIKLPGQLLSRDGDLLSFHRTFRPGGFYDSLNRPKQAGDFGRVEILVGSWVLRRSYFRSSGDHIGDLYNIQTPVELYPTGPRYLDLEVDLAAWPDGHAKVVDLQDLEDAMSAGFITRPLGKRALAIATSLHESMRSGQQFDPRDWLAPASST